MSMWSVFWCHATFSFRFPGKMKIAQLFISRNEQTEHLFVHILVSESVFFNYSLSFSYMFSEFSTFFQENVENVENESEKD